MSSMNFTCLEKLPSLLNKTCSQTMRKAWIDKKIPIPLGWTSLPDNEFADTTEDKPAKYKVGDVVKLVWDRDSINQEYCSKCLEGDITIMFPNDGCMNCGAGCEHSFNHLLGRVEITEVFQIEMVKEEGEFYVHTAVGGTEGYDTFYLMPGYKGYDEAIEDFAKLDGFGSAEKLFSYMDTKYDLSSPKKFYVYKFKWL